VRKWRCEQRPGLLEHPQLQSPLFADLPRSPERTQSLGERLVRQLDTDEIDGPPEEHLEPGVAGTTRELGAEPRLADARFPGNEDGRTASLLRRGKRALELTELACASDEHLTRASLDSGRYRATHLSRESRS
jgi:hypothetical protein